MTTKPEMPKPDKYDETEVWVVYSEDEGTADLIGVFETEEEANDAREAHGKEVDDDEDVIIYVESTTLKLRRAFPSAPSDAETREPAADARATWEQALRAFCEKNLEGSGYNHIHIDTPGDVTAAAEIEAFAAARIEPWREALQALYDEQNGAPLIRHADKWQAAMNKTEKLLFADDAKETK